MPPRYPLNQLIATGIYYTLTKKLRVIALREAGLVNYICLYQDREPYICDLHDEMLINPITDASVRVYEEELEEVF